VLRVARLAAVVVATVAVALAVTTWAWAATPTRASWTTAANGICGAGNAQIRRLAKGTAPTVRSANFLAIAHIVSRENARLTVLPRPVSELPNITFFLTKSLALVPLYGQAARAAARSDNAAVTRVLTTIKQVRSWRDYTARVLEAPVCAEAW